MTRVNYKTEYNKYIVKTIFTKKECVEILKMKTTNIDRRASTRALDLFSRQNWPHIAKVRAQYS